MAASGSSDLEHPVKTDGGSGASLPCFWASRPRFIYGHEKAYLQFMSQHDKLKAAGRAIIQEL